MRRLFGTDAAICQPQVAAVVPSRTVPVLRQPRDVFGRFPSSLSPWVCSVIGSGRNLLCGFVFGVGEGVPRLFGVVETRILVLGLLGLTQLDQRLLAGCVNPLAERLALEAVGGVGFEDVSDRARYLVGTGCAWAEGAIFAQVPAMFPNSSGSVAGIVGGVGTVGGIVYPLIYSAPWLANFHIGYSVTAVSMIPIVLLAAWVFQPEIAAVANSAGFVGESGDAPSATPSDD